jgi:Flp pilus assembly protein CpaB
VSVASIAVGEQISATDFSHTAATLGSYLKGDERAIAVSFDSEHGITSYLGQGDTVDVIAQAKKGSEDLFQNISVLENSNGNVVLELTDRQSLLLTHALELGDSLWLTLRPISHATDSVRLGQIVGVN